MRPEAIEAAAKEQRAAVAAAISCYLMWGLMPLMFQAMGRSGISPWEITGHRALWSVFWAGGLVLLARQGGQVMAILREAPGVVVLDRREAGGYITPVESVGEHAVYVSRIRKDPTIKNGLNLWCVSDNLRKGAALNAVQIAQLLDRRGLLERSGS